MCRQHEYINSQPINCDYIKCDRWCNASIFQDPLFTQAFNIADKANNQGYKPDSQDIKDKTRTRNEGPKVDLLSVIRGASARQKEEMG